LPDVQTHPRTPLNESQNLNNEKEFKNMPHLHRRVQGVRTDKTIALQTYIPPLLH
jgi:hypothetical protein